MRFLKDNKLNDILVHSINVSNYAVILGKELNLNKKELEILKIGGLLHDIGKFRISKDILNKNTKLTNEEYEIIKKHSKFGELLLSNDCEKEIKEIVRNHHERIDGNGYPDGLKANEIPYYVKIISICDAFDAMTTKRSYNIVKTIDEALEELYLSSIPQINANNEIIQQFDADLVNSFISAIKNNNKNKQYYLH